MVYTLVDRHQSQHYINRKIDYLKDKKRMQSINETFFRSSFEILHFVLPAADLI